MSRSLFNMSVLYVVLSLAALIYADTATNTPASAVDALAANAQQRLEKAMAELAALRQQVAEQQVPLSQKLSQLEGQLSAIRLEYQQKSRLLDSRTLDLSNLRNEIKSRQDEAAYLSNLLGEYIRNFESRLHIAELQRYKDDIEQAKLAPENTNLTQEQIFAAQAQILTVSLQRFEEALGGMRFEGTAVDSAGRVKTGHYLIAGPIALFQSQDGQTIGIAEQRLGSLEPTVLPFGNPQDAQAAAMLFSDKKGLFPLDPTLGNARKIEQTKETWLEHVKKGGPVMYPIFILAGAAFLVALVKWVSMLFVPVPSAKRLAELLTAVAKRDTQKALAIATSIGGPVGQMLAAGVEHLHQPRELIEEVMYEKMLAAKLKLERFLPFIAISASSAPLLGLLGTVTGIINTFKLITVFGSGDVKTLSGGISEALITTEYGLIVAIPSLLIHAFLSRKAKNVVNQMEKSAVALINQISKMAPAPNSAAPAATRIAPVIADGAALGAVEPSISVESIVAAIKDGQ